MALSWMNDLKEKENEKPKRHFAEFPENTIWSRPQEVLV